MSVQMLFNPNGAYSQLTECSGVSGQATYALRITGNYRIDANLGVIRLTNLQSDPARQPNGQPYLASDSETDNYTLRDANALTISNSVCGSACTITYTRP
jgi:hypothetical protein